MDINLHDFVSNFKNDELFRILGELSSQLDPFTFQRILNRRNQNKYTLLHTAIFCRNCDALKQLIEMGTDMSIKCFGTPYLHLIAYSLVLPDIYLDDWRDGFIALLKASSDLLTARDDQGTTILHLLCEFDQAAYLEFVRDNSDSETFNTLVESKDRLGLRPIHKAALGNSTKSLTILLNSNASVSSQTLAGETAVHIAAMKKNVEFYNMISKHCQSTGSNEVIQIKDRYGRTASEIYSMDGWNLHKESTAIISHKLCLKHSTCAPSKLECLNNAPPENSKRLSVLIDEKSGVLRGNDLSHNLQYLEAKKAAISDVLRVHDWSYIKRIQQVCSQVSPNVESSNGIGHLDGDTAISNLSFLAALHACGAVCDGVDLVVKKQVRNVFCCVRPPGHHAGPRGVVKSSEDGPDSHGFCLLNNASIAAGYALNVHRDTIKRAAIVDFDVHHGNGTEETVRYLRPKIENSEMINPLCFGTLHTPVYKPWFDQEDSSNVLFVSVHGFGARERGLEFLMPKSAFYPGSGSTKFPSDDQIAPKVPVAAGVTDLDTGDDDDKEEGDDDEDEDDESYNDNSDAAPEVAVACNMSSVASLKSVFSSDALLNESNIPIPMSPPLILDIGITLPPETEIDDGGLSYRFSWRDRWRNEIFPRLIKFEPDLIIISAGFDGHRKDLINAGYLALVEEDFAWVTERLIQVANTCCDGRVVSALEGGYMLGGEFCSSFAKSVKTHVSTLINGAKTTQTYSAENELKDREFELKYVQDTISRRINKLHTHEVKHMESMNEQLVSPVEAAEAAKGKRRRSEVNYAELDKEMNQEK